MPRREGLTNKQQRSAQKKEQSPSELIGEKRSNAEQVERYGLLSGDAGDQFFIPGENDQLHHLKGLRVFDGLFANTTVEQSQVLSSILGGSGNQIANQYWTPQPAHQGLGDSISVHNLMRQRGLDNTAAKAVQNELLWEIDNAADAPFRYKMHLAQRYKNELMPQTRQAYDESMTAYYEPSTEAQMEARWRAIKYINSMKQLPVGD